VYSNNTVEAAVDCFTNVIPQAIGLVVPQDFIRKFRFPHWFSHTLIYYIRENNYFYRRYKKNKNEYFIINFPITGSLLKLKLSLTDLTPIRA
jgi:hypothetical protein